MRIFSKEGWKPVFPSTLGHYNSLVLTLALHHDQTGIDDVDYVHEPPGVNWRWAFLVS